jgi:hypothetical protein
MMTTRLASRALLALLLASTVACSSDGPTASLSPSTDASVRRGGSATAAALPVAGRWEGEYPFLDRPDASRRWTLNLVQRDEKLEGSLTTWVTTEDGRTLVGTSSLVSGSGVAGRTVTVRFPTGEGADTKVSYTAEVSADGQSMTGWYTFSAAPITLVRR